MESWLGSAASTFTAFAAALGVFLAFIKSPPGKWLVKHNVSMPARALVADVVAEEVKPLSQRVETTNTAFEIHMREEGRRIVVEQARDYEIDKWRREVDARMEDGLIRFDRIEVTQARVEAKIDGLVQQKADRT